MGILIKGIAIGIFAVSFGILLRATTLATYPDFHTFYYGPQAVFQGSNPYLPADAFTEFLYPPFALMVFLPLSLFALPIAAKVWVFLSIFFLLFAIVICFKIFNKKVFSNESLLLAAAVFSLFPVKFTLGMGQVNHLVLLLTVLIIYLLNNRKDSLAGVIYGSLLSLKLYPLLLFLYLFVKKKWLFIIATAATIALLAGISVLVVPERTQQYFYSTVLPSLATSWKSDYYNQALSGVIIRSLSNPSQIYILQYVISFLMIATSFLVIRRYNTIPHGYAPHLEVSSVLLLSLLINNFSWQHHFVLVIFPFFTTYYFLRSIKGSIWLYVLLFISYLLIAGNLKNPGQVPVILQSHVFWGTLLLFMMINYLLMRKYD
jgi:alpha-1,2-mannosyltransferase